MIHSVANETQTTEKFSKKCCHQTLIIHYHVSISIEYLVKKSSNMEKKGFSAVGISVLKVTLLGEILKLKYLSTFMSCIPHKIRFVPHRRIFFLLLHWLELHIQILQNIFSSTSADGVSTEKSLRKISFRQFNLFDVVRLVYGVYKQAIAWYKDSF